MSELIACFIDTEMLNKGIHNECLSICVYPILKIRNEIFVNQRWRVKYIFDFDQKLLLANRSLIRTIIILVEYFDV